LKQEGLENLIYLSFVKGCSKGKGTTSGMVSGTRTRLLV